MTQEQRGKLLRSQDLLRSVITEYGKYSYLSSWEDEQLRKIRESQELVKQVIESE